MGFLAALSVTENYLKLDWNPTVYKKYVPRVGSATAQQVVRKNNEAWRGFLALKRMERNRKLPSIINRVNRVCCQANGLAYASTLGWMRVEPQQRNAHPTEDQSGSMNLPTSVAERVK
jgi:hypothetical protein